MEYKLPRQFHDLMVNVYKETKSHHPDYLLSEKEAISYGCRLISHLKKVICLDVKGEIEKMKHINPSFEELMLTLDGHYKYSSRGIYNQALDDVLAHLKSNLK